MIKISSLFGSYFNGIADYTNLTNIIVTIILPITITTPTRFVYRYGVDIRISLILQNRSIRFESSSPLPIMKLQLPQPVGLQI
jgi:hypothetical protein